MRGSRATSGLRTGTCAFLTFYAAATDYADFRTEWGNAIFIPALFLTVLGLFVLTQIAPPNQFSKTYNITGKQNRGVIFSKLF